jgi:hypothetical protein
MANSISADEQPKSRKRSASELETPRVQKKEEEEVELHPTKREKDMKKRLIVILEQACLETYKVSSGKSSDKNPPKFTLLNW